MSKHTLDVILGLLLLALGVGGFIVLPIGSYVAWRRRVPRRARRIRLSDQEVHRRFDALVAEEAQR